MYRYIHINYPGSREKKGCHEKKLLPSRYTVAQPVAYKAGTPHRGASDASEDSELHTRNFQVCRGPMYVYYYRTYEKAVSGGGRGGKRRTCAKGPYQPALRPSPQASPTCCGLSLSYDFKV